MMRLPRLALLLIIPAFVCGASPSTPPHIFFNVVDGTQLDSDKNYVTAQLPESQSSQYSKFSVRQEVGRITML